MLRKIKPEPKRGSSWCCWVGAVLWHVPRVLYEGGFLDRRGPSPAPTAQTPLFFVHADAGERVCCGLRHEDDGAGGDRSGGDGAGERKRAGIMKISWSSRRC